MSEYGTGSGGQLETPAYIIRAASIASALGYAEGGNHLRMVLVDEAFSKMDESRSREVIDYLTGSLGLQLIFIMPTSKCGPFMDLIVKLPPVSNESLRIQLQVGGARGTPADDSKGQVDPVLTGCPYADSVLLPAIRRRGRMDQESRR